MYLKFLINFNRNSTTPGHRLGDYSLANTRSSRISENANIPSHDMHPQLQTGGIFEFKKDKEDKNDRKL